jgi:DNA-binding FadR family transcriptional regulator
VLDLFSVALKEVMDSEAEPAYSAPEDRARVQKAHEDIAEAVLAGHAEKAERLMRAHVKEFADNMEANQPGFMSRPIEWTWPK